ncbi:hypothetical protein BFV94_4127 [Alteromonas macleodii]|uniref:Uncharacterized protein n=1 Tax=Alteromonas macleodii TaxID=28108 RepID=A0AB36FTN8_ALTMA|nr:hypothetical protein BFV95_4136 [Alteromonas macleodii]OES26550.1 hypothetical protein BFV94_4127 [Alteromonas macleodii]OES27134.1 hypothetical protein BFV93_4125 [Alteromonas macleodii]OES39320.1 hypothetical protein BFV96_4117 [Alteromonas macleodii]
MQFREHSASRLVVMVENSVDVHASQQIRFTGIIYLINT